MSLSDRELMLLEQVTYLTSDVYKAAGIKKLPSNQLNGLEISDLLTDFTEDKLATLSQSDKMLSGVISGKEWAGIIRQLKKEPHLLDLEIKDKLVIDASDGISTKKAVVGLVFEDKKAPGSAVVAFRGTTGTLEWYDNGLGVFMADTPSQREALAFIEKQPYNDITVTGHSKGANKAMYVTLLSNKVTRCFCLDGQGFGKNFYAKYWAEVRAKGHLITNASVSKDYVHILLFQVLGSTQLYFKGNNFDSMMEYHSSNSFFITDEAYNMVVQDGQVALQPEAEAELISFLHGFSNYLSNQTTPQEQETIGKFVGKILSSTFRKRKMTKEDWKNLLLENRDNVMLLTAALIQYSKANDLSEATRKQILQLMHLEALIPIVEFNIDVKDSIVNKQGVSSVKDWLYEFEKEQLFINHDMYVNLKAMLGYEHEDDIIDIIKGIDAKLDKFPEAGGYQEISIRDDKIYDFSISTYQTLIETIAKIEHEAFPSLSSWRNYQTEAWYDDLFINSAISAVNQYADRLSEMNSESRKRIDVVFDEVAEIDKSYAEKLRESNQALRQVSEKITELCDAIG